LSVTPQTPDASNTPAPQAGGPYYVPQQQGSGPFIPQQQGAGNVPPWTPQGMPAVAPQPTNNAATTGFVIGLTATVIAIVPILGTVSWLLAPVGIVFAIVGLTRATPSNGTVGRNKAIWGIVLGLVALVICTIYVSAIARHASTTSSSSSTGSYSAPYTYSAPAPSYSAPSSSGSSSGSYSSSSGSAAAQPVDPNTFSAGTYEVGTDIQPGTYKTTGSSYCYYARLKADDGELDSIISNDIVQGQGSVSVKSSDKYIEFSGTCTWTKK
jgi:hypothetical protein